MLSSKAVCYTKDGLEQRVLIDSKQKAINASLYNLAEMCETIENFPAGSKNSSTFANIEQFAGSFSHLTAH